MSNYVHQFRIPENEPTPGVYGKSDSFRLHWDINTYCDKDCFYCYARKQLVWNKMSTKTVLDNILDQLRGIVDKELEVILLGGEPSLHPLYFYILDQLEEMPNLLGSAVISNAGRKVNQDWIDKHVKYKKFWFNYSYHPTETNDIYTDFLDKVLYTRQKFDNVIVNVLLVGPRCDKEIRTVVDFCKANDICMRPNVLYNPKTCAGYLHENKKYREWIAKYQDDFERYLYFTTNASTTGVTGDEDILNDIDVYLRDLNQFKGWACLNNNYSIEGSNNTKITRMCDKTQTGEYMKCTLDRCICQGLLTNKKTKE